MKWGELISLEYGKQIKDKSLKNGSVPVYGTNGQIGTSNLPPLCPIPSFILGRKGAYRGVHFSEIPFSVIDTAFYAIPKTDKINMKWAYYKFLTYDINKMDSGSAIPSTDRYEIYSIDLDLPEVKTQEKIVLILEALDKKIQINNMINDNLEQQAQIFYLNLFIQKADPKWKQGILSDLGSIVGGSTPSKANNNYYTKNGIAWITPKDLATNKSKFIYRGEKDISDLGLKNSSTKIMPKGTVLFSSRAPIGYIAIAANEVTTNQGFKSVIPKENIGTEFIYYFLKNNIKMIESMASGSTFNEVSGSTMKKIPVTIPDTETLIHFRKLCLPLFKQQKILEKQNIALISLRNNLLTKLMSGEIYIS